jgi:hypothetical protein
MNDTHAARRVVASAIEHEGARAAWFEEFGRDADAEEAYLTEVDASTVYVGIANAIYGRLNPPGLSATEKEYERAREMGKRVAFFVAAEAPGREAHLARFLDRVRYYVTTENYLDASDLARRVARRLHELASEALSPWIKLGDLVFRADEVDDSGATVTISARVSDAIAHALEASREQRHGDRPFRLIHGNRVIECTLTNLRRRTRAGSSDFTLELTAGRDRAGKTRVATSGHSANDLVEQGVRELFLGERRPKGMLDFLTDIGVDAADLRQAFDQPNETAEAIARLVVAEGMIASGSASRILRLAVGPRVGDMRRFELSWLEPVEYSNVEPERRTVAGEWRRR